MALGTGTLAVSVATAMPSSTTSQAATIDLDATLDPLTAEVEQLTDRVATLDHDVTTWFELADCESGEWSAPAVPVPGSATWTDGLTTDEHPFQGGLHFAESTWDSYRDPDMPEHAGDATALAQMEVAERVHDDQGWQAWPVCSEVLGLS